MQDLKKQQLIEYIFKVGNLLEECRLHLQFHFTILRRKYSHLSNEIFSQIMHEFTEEKYTQQTKELFYNTFNENELEEIFRFWSSPAGRKLVKGEFLEKQKNLELLWNQNLENACKSIEGTE